MEELAGAKTAKEAKRCYWYNLLCEFANILATFSPAAKNKVNLLLLTT